MKGNKTKNDGSTKGVVIHNVGELKRRAIHPQEDKTEGNLYPTDEIAEELEDISVNSDGSSFKTSSSTYDSSPEKTDVRHRSGKGSTLNESTETSSKANTNQSDVKQIILIILGCLICLIIFYIFWVFTHTTTEGNKNIENIMKDIKITFPAQPPLTYRVLNSALKSASSDSKKPGILVLLASKEAKSKISQFALDLANALSKPPVVIKFNSSVSANQLKKDIDETIKQSLNENDLKAVIVEDLDNLPFDAAMIFHSYCDHENAPFKRVLYILTITSDEEIQSSSTSRELDELASQRLNSVWKNSGDDQVSSLISRLTASVAGIKL